MPTKDPHLRVGVSCFNARPAQAGTPGRPSKYRDMTLLGNLIWLVFGGFTAAVGTILGGLALCLTIVGIPFGLQTIKIGLAMFLPFGKEVVVDPGADSTLNTILNVVWIVLWGWALALNHLVFAALLALTIVGIPFAKQHLKLMWVSLLPFGRRLA